MSKGHLSNDEFFQRLTELFDERRQQDYGSVTLTQKRLTYGEDVDMSSAETTSSAPFPDLNLSQPTSILIRATNGLRGDYKSSKVKLSTVVKVDALEGFYAKYADICKLGMNGLKKRDRSKAKEKLKAKKKKAVVCSTEVKK